MISAATVKGGGAKLEAKVPQPKPDRGAVGGLWWEKATAIVQTFLQASVADSKEEEAFVRGRLERRDVTTANICTGFAIGYHLLSLATDNVIVAPVDLGIFRAMHLIFLSLHFARLSLPNAHSLKSRYGLWLMQLAFVAAMGHMLSRTIGRDVVGDAILASSGLLAVSGFLLLVCPYHGLMIPFTSLAYWLIAYAAIHGSPFGARWLFIHALVLGAFTIVQSLLIMKARILALAEYRTLRQVAPAQVLRGTMDSARSLEESFRLALRPVACVSSDWRNYQKYSQALSPSQVAATLKDYYDLCDAILAKVAPDGNYYSDWIADELFVVFFAESKSDLKRILDQAFEFGQDLLAAKEAFFASHGMPKSIDLGISGGESLVGMMGPSRHRKATSLGEIPGRARRLQSAGKFLRHKLGDTDRIIVDPTVAGLLTATSVLSRFELRDRRLRDLEHQMLYYAEARHKNLRKSA